MTDPTSGTATRRGRLRGWYETTFMPLYARWTPAVLAFCLLLSFTAMGGTLINQRTQDRADEHQRAVTKTLLGCFDTYADKFSSVTKEVRAAQVHTDTVEGEADKAAAERDAAFQSVLLAIVAQDTTDEEGLALFAALTDANAVLVEKRQALVAARLDLQQTRADHPIPEPPSVFCELPE